MAKFFKTIHINMLPVTFKMTHIPLWTVENYKTLLQDEFMPAAKIKINTKETNSIDHNVLITLVTLSCDTSVR